MNVFKLALLIFLFAINAMGDTNSDLFNINSLERHGLPFRVSKVFPKEMEEQPVLENYILEVDLGRLTREEYNFLVHIYGSFSPFSYDEDYSYKLLDFLAPPIQALNNKFFESKEFMIYPFNELSLFGYDYLLETPSAEDYQKLVRYGLESGSNCWNTSFEVLDSVFSKADNKLNLYIPDPKMAWEILNSNFIAIEEGQENIYDLVVLRIGDNHKPHQILLHTALLVGKDIVFEKINDFATTPFRLAQLSDVIDKYKNYYGSDLIVEYKRKLGRQKLGKHTLPLEDPILLNIISTYWPETFLKENFIVESCGYSNDLTCRPYLQLVTEIELTQEVNKKYLQLDRESRNIDSFHSIEIK